MELLQVLGLSVAMVALAVMMHLGGLTLLLHLARLHIHAWQTPWLAVDRVFVPTVIVVGLFVLHALEAGLYAAVLVAGGVTDNLEQAAYLSASAYSTAGWTGLEVPDQWRVFVALESIAGLLLLGWSTAFLFQTLHRILMTEETHPLPAGAIASRSPRASGSRSSTSSPRSFASAPTAVSPRS